MKINTINQQSFIKVPTILSKNKMKSAIENMTGIKRNNIIADTWLYDNDANYLMVLYKYLKSHLELYYDFIIKKHNMKK